MLTKSRTDILDRRIRKLRQLVFHPNDNIAERADVLLAICLTERRELRRLEPTHFDRFGNSPDDLACLAKNGLTITDFM